MSRRDVDEDARERYARAVELAERIRDEWEGLGCPLMAEGGATGRAVVRHPLVAMLMDAERDCQRLSHEVAVQSESSAPLAEHWRPSIRADSMPLPGVEATETRCRHAS